MNFHDTVSSSLCRQFAETLSHSTSFSAEANEKAASCLLDFLASVFSTGHFPWVQQARLVARNNSQTVSGGAAIIGTPYRVSVRDAAFANAVAGHSLVRDDMHVGSVSHLGVVVIPTALALAEQESVNGRQLLEAIICGYEAGARLGSLLMDVETVKKFRPTGLIGAFAAAATGCRLTGLDSGQTANALGFAANYISGLNEWAGWGSDDMYFHPGIAASNGITAMQLAREGAVAAPGSLEGKSGLFAALGKARPDNNKLPFSDGEEILHVFFKQVPACNYAQTAAQAARRTSQEHSLQPDDIESVLVKVPHAAAHYPGCDFSGPFNSILQARMSIHFNVASALVHGDFRDANFSDFNNPAVAGLSNRTKVQVDSELTTHYPDRQGACIDITTRDGRICSVSLDDVIHATQEEVKDRFNIAAANCLGETRATSLRDLLKDMQETDSLDELFSLLTIIPETTDRR